MKKDIFPGDFEIFPSSSSSVSEIFKNQFDITWHQMHRDSGSNQRVWGLIEGEHSIDDGTVSYKYNNEYFRSDEFTANHSGRHLLFAGCSETEGQGGNIEDSWGHILFEKIQQCQDVSGFYNLGKSGYGWQKVINQVRLYISKYAKPDNLFVLLPNFGRSIDWSDEVNDWHAKQEYPRFGTNKMLDSTKNIYLSEQTVQRYKKSFVDFVISWRLFEDYCEAADIKLVWGTWEPIDNYNISKFDIFNNFVSLPKDDLPSMIDEYRGDAAVTDLDLDKRDGHHGRLYHEYWADKMLKEAQRRGFLND